MAEFGLGSAATVDTIEVTWPYGSVQDTVAVASNQTITITEYDLAGVTRSVTAPRELVLYGTRPNPFRGMTTVSFAAAVGKAVTLRIYDIRGRLVATLLDRESVKSGAQTVDWDGKDMEGRSAAPGLYFLRLESGGFAETHRVVHLR
jgi:flagellar hook assembly protein FlgD